MTPENLVSYSAQVAILVMVCAALPRALGLRSPGLQYVFWRLLLGVCLLLPIAEPWRHEEMAFVAAPAAAVPPGGVAGAPAAIVPPDVGPSLEWVIVTGAEVLLLLGIAARLAWLSLGVFRLRRMRRRASEPADAFGDLQQTIGAPAAVFWSPDVRHPVTFGILRPVVLLPVALRTADAAAQRAVVAHELHHVKRRDWAWILGEEIVRSIFWFHPAMWWLVSRVQLARETVVDELSILTTNARRAYLDTLLAFADDTGLASTPAFSARRHLFHRVMLLSKEGSMSSLRIAIGSCVLVVALGAGTWGAVYAFPLASVTLVTDQNPPRDPLTPETYVQRSTFAFEKARKDTSLTREEKLDLVKRGIADDDRALSINPQYRPALAYKTVLLRMAAELTDDAQARDAMIREADELRQKAIALGGRSSLEPMTRTTPGQLPPPPPPPPPAVKQMPPPPPPPPPPGMETRDSFSETLELLQPIRIGGNMKAPVKLKDVKPVYPDDARAARVQGVVIVEAIIDAAGYIADTRILRSIPMLDEAARKAVSQWEFAPTLLNGEPTPIIMTVTVNFKLE
jgi:TonB family protein